MKKACSVLVLIGLLGCKGAVQERFLTSIPDPVCVAGRTYDEDIVTLPPSQIELMGDNLFLFRTMQLLAQGIDKKTGVSTINLGYIGDGPGEFISPYFVGENKKDSTYYVFDYTYNLMRKYKWEMKQDTFLFHLLKEIKREDRKVAFYTVCRMEHDYFVALSESQETCHPFVLLDKNLHVISEFGEMLEDGKYMNPRLYHGGLASFKDQVVYASIDFGYLVSYRISADGIIEKLWEHFFSPIYFNYDKEKTGIDWHRNLRGFYDVKMTEKYIYCLYSGEPSNVNVPREVLPDKILVFKHDGTLVKNFLIDKESGRIAIEKDSILYVSYISPDSGIAFYDIGGLLDN